jgi:hypothetical protein
MNIFESMIDELLKIVGYYPIAFFKWVLGGFKKPYKAYLDYESSGYNLLRVIILFGLVSAILFGIFH